MSRHTKKMFWFTILPFCHVLQFSVDASDRFFDINIKCIGGALRKMANELRTNQSENEYVLTVTVDIMVHKNINKNSTLLFSLTPLVFPPGFLTSSGSLCCAGSSNILLSTCSSYPSQHPRLIHLQSLVLAFRCLCSITNTGHRTYHCTVYLPI